MIIDGRELSDAQTVALIERLLLAAEQARTRAQALEPVFAAACELSCVSCGISGPAPLFVAKVKLDFAVAKAIEALNLQASFTHLPAFHENGDGV